MDQIKDSTADQHRRRRTQPTKLRCFLGCFGGGGASEDEKLPQRRFKSINQSRWFSSCFKLRSKKSPKRTVPVESQSSTDEKVNHEKGRRVLGRSKSKSNKKMIDELPAKGDDEISNQPPVAGDVLHGKANKTRSGKGIFLRNSKSMNHMEVLDSIKENPSSKKGTETSLRKSKSAKSTTSVNNQTGGGGGGDSQVIRPTRRAEISLSPSQSVAAQPEITGRGDYGDDDENNNRVKKRDEKNKGSIDRVVGISIIVMVLLIMAVWGKLCAILCSSAWLYFYPLLLRANHNNGNSQHVVGQSNNKALEILHGNSQWQKKKVVFQGFLQRDHQII